MKKSLQNLSDSRFRLRQGMTLVEMLIAMTLTLILMAAVAQAFSVFGRGVNKSRNSIELRQQGHAVTIRIRQDLGGLTLVPNPPANPSQNVGYFEYIEGPKQDLPAGASSLQGDVDDILMFTTESQGAPFVGTLSETAGSYRSTIQTPAAEILYYCAPAAASPNPDLQTYNLHRRQRLVMVHPYAKPFIDPATGLSPDGSSPNTFPAVGATFAEQYNNALDETDVSFRIGRIIPNSLGDLTRRENRFFHAYDPALLTDAKDNDHDGTVDEQDEAYSFPHRFCWESDEFDVSRSGRVNGYGVDGARYGDDVILTNVISFDVRAYDPLCPIRLASTDSGDVVTVVPGDPGFSTASASQLLGTYVDLGYANADTVPVSAKYPPINRTFFDSWGMLHSRLEMTNAALQRPTYDTWSTHYERNGVGDWAWNDTDDDGDGLIDEFDERDTSPPYPVALRGLEIRIRCYEPSTRSIRQLTVRHVF